MKCKIAVVQFAIKENSSTYNLNKAKNFIQKASLKKAHIIVFPENFVTGLMKSKENVKLHSYLTFFQKLAKKYQIDIVPGSLVEVTSGIFKKNKKTLHNTAYYISSMGKILAKYRKINLWHPERPFFKPGKTISVFDTKHGKIGLTICWDLAFPELFSKMIKKGVDIVICPSYWCYGDAGMGIKYDINSEVKLVDSLCISMAFLNEIILVYCNVASIGKKKIDSSIGHSQITIPFKGVLRKLNHHREEMFIQKIDTDILHDAEKVYKIRKDKIK